MKGDYRTLAELVLSGKQCVRCTRISGAELGKSEIFEGEEAVRRVAQAHGAKSFPCIVEDEDGRVLLERFSGERYMIVCGGGHVSLAVTELCHLLGYHVTVVDDREDFANKARFPWADEVVCADFEEFFAHYVPPQDADLSVIIVTRGHAADAECLAYALQLKTEYIGMIGSKSKNKFVYEKLKKQGVDESEFERVHSPIGLMIGAETPEEIAVSIAAELVQERRRDQPSLLSSKMLRAITHCESGVMATVVRSDGSTPRGVGARMFFPKGEGAVGTVGGGASEYEVVKAAAKMLEEGPTARLCSFTMHNGTAADLGMVCGGDVDILFEPVEEE